LVMEETPKRAIRGRELQARPHREFHVRPGRMVFAYQEELELTRRNPQLLAHLFAGPGDTLHVDQRGCEFGAGLQRQIDGLVAAVVPQRERLGTAAPDLVSVRRYQVGTRRQRR